MEPQPRRFGRGAIAVLAITAIVVPLYLWTAVSGFVPHRFYGILFYENTGRIRVVYHNQPAEEAGVRVGDHLVDVPHGDVYRGLALEMAHVDTLRVATSRGIVSVRAQLTKEPIGTALAAFVLGLSVVVLVGFATLLYLRRPGLMAFAFWLWAIMQGNVADMLVALDRLPVVISLPLYAVTFTFGLSAIALIPFALRFPDGRVSARMRWLDTTAWLAFGGGVATDVVLALLRLAGLWGDNIVSFAAGRAVQAIALPVVAAIFALRYVRSNRIERAKTAWAIAGFIGSILAQTGAWAAVTFAMLASFAGLVPATFGLVPLIEQRLLTALASLFPLLAIYPILRYRLFDLGFALNRAALYSILTVAAVATLAGVNWLAQHFVTERLALVLQPVAAIVIGLGYLRVRGWTQTFLERTLFRERFAAEQQLDATIRGFPLVEGSGAIDESLTVECTDVLSLQSAAVFRVRDAALARVASVGWDDANLGALQRDDRLLRRLLTDGPAVRLAAVHWSPSGLPAPPSEPVVAMLLAQAGVLIGVVFYGRHRNGTEIDPEEMRLLRRLCEAAAVAYQTAEMRAELVDLRLRLALKPEPA